VIRFRSFLNTDPPHLAAIWRSQPLDHRLVQPMTADLLERHVLCKSHFDREGLIVAVDGAARLGFVHAGFGPCVEHRELSHDLGVICMLMVQQDLAAEVRTRVAMDLLARGESYLQGQGAKVLYAGAIFPLNPFYLGLYGGSELPGVLDSDTWTRDLYLRSGYREIDRVLIYRRDLTRFRPIVNRQQHALRRRMDFRVTLDPPSSTWWQALTLGDVERVQFELVSRARDESWAKATFWNIEPLSTSWGVSASGILDLVVDEARRRQGLATCLLGEALSRLQQQGTTLVEAQTMQHNEAARGLYHHLGFGEEDSGTVLRKDGG